MPVWSYCREVSYGIEAQRLQRQLEVHAKGCRNERDCPLHLLECVAARCICLRLRDGIEIVPWPAAAKR